MKPLTTDQLKRLDAAHRQPTAHRAALRPVMRWQIDCTTGKPVAQWCLAPDPAQVLGATWQAPTAE